MMPTQDLQKDIMRVFGPVLGLEMIRILTSSDLSIGGSEGAGLIYQKSGTLTASDINNCVATPVEIVPAEPDVTFYPFAAYLDPAAVLVAYDFTGLVVGFGSNKSDPLCYPTVGVQSPNIGASPDILITLIPFENFATAPPIKPNLPLIFSASSPADVTAGDGDVPYWVAYLKIPA